MFSFFRKKPAAFPPFDTVEQSPLRDVYFYRTATWYWSGKMVAVVDKYQPRIITMDPWPEMIFLAALGQRTVKEYIYDMADMFGKNQVIPPDLDEMILEHMEIFHADYRIIEFSPEPVVLLPDVAGPKNASKNTGDA